METGEGRTTPPHIVPSADPAELILQVLDHLIALGELARQLCYTLGRSGNGHHAKAAAELINRLKEGI